jgi:hypothetical protein
MPTAEIFIVNDFSGVQKGTKDNPYSVKTASEFDGLLASQLYDENKWFRPGLLLNIGDGEFLTGGCYEWGPFATIDRPRLGPDWQVRGTGSSTISLDPNAISDAMVNDWPLHALMSASQWMQYLWQGRDLEWAALTPEQFWANISRKQLVRDITFNLNYSKFIDRWIAFGKALKLSGGILQGHGGAYENVHVKDFGAHYVVGEDGQRVGLGAEAFPLMIAGGVDGFDRNKISRLPSSYQFDSDLPDIECAHHTGCSFSEFSDADSNDQVSLCIISGSIGQPSLPPLSAGDATAPYVHHLRRFAYQQHNPIGDFPNSLATRNQIQAFTIYQAARADVSFNSAKNIQCGSYADFYKSQNVDVHDNEFLRVLRGVAFLLSPTGTDAEHFTSLGHKVRRNKITQISCDSDGHAAILLWKFDAEGPDRYLGDITIGGKGEENDISIEGPAGKANIAIKAIGVDKLTIGQNKIDPRYGRGQQVLEHCTNVVVTRDSFWQKLINFFKHLLGKK